MLTDHKKLENLKTMNSLKKFKMAIRRKRNLHFQRCQKRKKMKNLMLKNRKKKNKNKMKSQNQKQKIFKLINKNSIFKNLLTIHFMDRNVTHSTLKKPFKNSKKQKLKLIQITRIHSQYSRKLLKNRKLCTMIHFYSCMLILRFPTTLEQWLLMRNINSSFSIFYLGKEIKFKLINLEIEALTSMNLEISYLLTVQDGLSLIFITKTQDME